MKKYNFNKFSVLLGILDYVNPIFYSFTMITIINSISSTMDKLFSSILMIGAIISIVLGLIIPTGKVIVGLGFIEFRMPVSLVFGVNFGIFLSGLMLLKYAFDLNLITICLLSLFIIVLLFIMYLKNKKINTIAVLTGSFGYLMIYFSLIRLSISNGILIPIIFYVLAILLFVMLCGIGIKADLKNPKVHWVIEISNVLCQLFVSIGTAILFLI